MSLPLAYRNFVSTTAFSAAYVSSQGEETLCIETRTYLDKLNERYVQMLFTKIGGNRVQVPSIQHLILRDKDCLSLSIPHSVVIDWGMDKKQAEVTEVYVPHHGLTPRWSIGILLSVDGVSYQTGPNETLHEALVELDEQMETQQFLWIRTCYQCNYSFPRLSGIQDDRENLQCFRDSPLEHFEEVKRSKKFASLEALQSGDFFVTAFHTCAAWKRLQSMSLKDVQQGSQIE